MPTCQDTTRAALGGDVLPQLRSRSLRFTRFAEPDLREEPRKRFFTDAFKLNPETAPDYSPLARWLSWLTRDLGLKPDDLLFSKLQSRLALHLSGGVMENAGILLDRFGYPYIPGSGVKGIARRAAMYALRTWCVDNQGNIPTDASEPASAICKGFDAADALAVAILRTFGWTDGEWKDGRRKKKDGTKGALHSDFEWAIGEGQPWIDARRRIAESLAAAESHRVKLDKGLPKDNFAGLAAFLDAKPIAAGYPTNGADLELDIVTCHHGDYYSQKKDAQQRVVMPVALDTEDPVPVYFPTVAAGITFVFAVRSSDASTADFARTCLKVALTTFGAGAKTAAGYGWFADVTDEIATRRAKEAEARRRAEEEAAALAKQAAELAARRKHEVGLAAMSPSDRADAELVTLSADWGRFKPHLTKFVERTSEQQAAILRWFNGAGKDRWLNEIKPDAAKGRKPWSRIIGEIHKAKKTHGISLP